MGIYIKEYKYIILFGNLNLQIFILFFIFFDVYSGNYPSRDKEIHFVQLSLKPTLNSKNLK